MRESATLDSWLERLPAFLRRDPDVVGTLYPMAMEMDRLEARLETIRTNLFPQHAVEMLPLYEAALRITSNPPGQTVAQRQASVKAHFRKALISASGITWQALVTLAVGPGWSWEVHDPADPGSPPPLNVIVRLPYAADSTSFGRNRALLRAITQSHIVLVVTSAEGFVLDRGHLDDDLF